ncbi:MAG TPA: PilN domain-containing protein [Terriglobia bacterium]|nr:PilN domain-containing protein [Terriglobia bacterium]
MMKINLLGEASPAAMKVAPASNASRQVLVFIVALAVMMSVVGFLYFYWSNQVHHEQNALTREQIRQKELAAVRAQNQKYQQQLKQLEARINTIQKLQSSRQGPVDFMTGLGNTVDSTKDLYLLQITSEGGVIHVRGESQTVGSIAQFIKALNDSMQFSNVLLKQYYQADRYGRRNFNFNLDCVYTPPEAAQPAPGQEAGGGR